MIKFTATIPDLKKALSISALATEEVSNSYALFDIKKENKAFLYSTDKDKRAVSYLPINDVEIDGGNEFIADPKRIQALINNSDSEYIAFFYNQETKTLNIYASEDKDAFISFESFEPENFLRFELPSEPTRIINAEIFLAGVKFIQGFLSNDDKNKKFSNLFINDGVMYGSNGSTRIGAFINPDINDIANLTLRRVMLPAIATMIDKTGISELAIKISDKCITFSSTDNLFCFGFRKSTITMPKFPISIDIPELDGFNINRAMFLKKLNRLSLASWEDIGIKMIFNNNENLEMQTATDRQSYERISCKRVSGNQPLNFIVECNKFKNVLNLFQASNVDIYVDKTKCTIHSTAEIVVEEDDKEPIKSQFTAIGLITLARII